MLRVLPPTFKPVLQQIRLLQVVKSCCEKERVVVLFTTKSVHVACLPAQGKLQSWTKVLGTILQYSYYSVISGLPLKTVHPFRDFLAVLPPPTLYKVETRKKFWINACNIVCGVRGGFELV